MPGSKYRMSGYMQDNPKQINVSLIRCNCVFLYIAQKQDI